MPKVPQYNIPMPAQPIRRTIICGIDNKPILGTLDYPKVIETKAGNWVKVYTKEQHKTLVAD